jgi:hypothetical protein
VVDDMVMGFEEVAMWRVVVGTTVDGVDWMGSGLARERDRAYRCWDVVCRLGSRTGVGRQMLLDDRAYRCWRSDP